MTQLASRDAFSANVRIELHIAGQCIPVAQIGGNRMIFDMPVTFSESVGELHLYIDDSVRRWRVVLPPASKPMQIIEANFEHIT